MVEQLLTLPAALAVLALLLGMGALLAGLGWRQPRWRQAGVFYLVSSGLISLPTLASPSLTPLELLQQASRIFSTDKAIQVEPDPQVQQPPNVAATWFPHNLLVEYSQDSSDHPIAQEAVTFRLDSDPTGALVMIGGAVVGQTPLALEFAAGTHIHYRIEKPVPETATEAYEPYEADIELLETSSVSVWLNRVYPPSP